jgi:hypothetical protein
MPKKNKSRKMRGGWDWPWSKKEETVSTSSEGTGMWDSLTKGVTSLTDSATSMVSTSPSPSDTTSQNNYQAPAYGGKRRRYKSRKMRGGYTDNVSLTNLASRAAPFSGETARAQAYVGGRKTRRRRYKKSHRRHHRK